MRTLKITARYVEIDPSDNQEIDVRVKVSDFDYYNVLQNYDTDDIIRVVGITRLIDAMDMEALLAYLESKGIKTIKEENL